MNTIQLTKRLLPIVLILAALLFGACQGGPDSGEATPTAEAASTEEPTEAPPPTTAPEPTQVAPLVVLLSPPGVDPELQSRLEAQISAEASTRGLRWQFRQTMTGEEIAAEVDYLVALPPFDGLDALVAAAPETTFLAIGFDGLNPAPNLILVRSASGSDEIEAFMGGYIGALITVDARIGIITVQDGLETARFTAFENGMRFFCGLCRPQYAPFYDYPFLLSLPAEASDVEWRALADFMRDRLVGTVYVSRGAGGQALIDALVDLGIDVVGGIEPEDGQSNWIASLRSDPDGAYLEMVPLLLDGETGIETVLPIKLVDVNPELLPDGRRRLAEQALADLLAGYILPGSVEAP